MRGNPSCDDETSVNDGSAPRRFLIDDGAMEEGKATERRGTGEMGVR
jgi:hypothetical protein